MNPIDDILLKLLLKPIPEKFVNLFAIERKRELKKYLHTRTITKEELVTLTTSSISIGYRHFIEYGEWIPEHLETTKEEKEAFQKSDVGSLDGKAAKYISKISNTFEERKYRVGHLFVGGRKWHLLFLELRDIKEENNHWKEGSHIHFTNHLVSNLSIDQVAEKFTTLDFNMGERFHVRFENKSVDTTQDSTSR